MLGIEDSLPTPYLIAVPLLGEFEIRPVGRAIRQLHHQLPTGVRPALLGLPNVGVLVGGCVIRETAAACGERLLNPIDRSRGVTSNHLGLGIACRNDI